MEVEMHIVALLCRSHIGWLLLRLLLLLPLFIPLTLAPTHKFVARMMQTHRYSRLSRPKGTTDSYDSLSQQYPPQHSQLEYWTNGNVTLLMSTTPSSEPAAATTVAAVPIAAKEAVFNVNAPTTTASRRTTRTLSSPKTRASSTAAADAHAVRNSIIAGSLAGIASTSSFYPFDLLRTKMQGAAALESTTTTTTTSSRSRPSTAASAHRGPVQVFVHTLQHGGIRALYTGMALPLTAQAIYKATVFSVNKVTTRALLEWKTQEARKVGNNFASPVTLSLADRFFCGSVGGAINAALFVTPVEFVRNQLIAQHSRTAHGITSKIHYSGPRDVIAHVVATKGIRGLWKGASMAVARDALGCGCFFFTFAVMSEHLPHDQASSTLIAGAASGLAFWVAALPLDTAKTWVQNGSASSGTSAIFESISNHGVLFTAKRLCRGYQVALGRGMPAAAVTVTTYEAVSRYLDNDGRGD